MEEQKAVILPGDQNYTNVGAFGKEFYIGEDVVEHVETVGRLVTNFNNIAFHQLLGLKLMVISAKQLVATVEKREDLYGHFGLLHGGVIASSFDGLGAYQAALAIYLNGGGVDSAALERRAGRIRTKKLEIEFLYVPRGKRFQISSRTLDYRSGSTVSEIVMTDDRGKQIARGNATYIELLKLKDL